MKKAFDQNVSRARPRLRLGGLTEAADSAAASLSPPSTEVTETVPQEAPPEVDEARGSARLGEAVKSRAERARAPRPSANESFERALDGTLRTTPVSHPEDDRPTSSRAEEIVAAATAAVLGEPVSAVAAPARPSAVHRPVGPPPPSARQMDEADEDVAEAAPTHQARMHPSPPSGVTAAPAASAPPPAVYAPAPAAFAQAAHTAHPPTQASPAATAVAAPSARTGHAPPSPAVPACAAPSAPRAHVAPPAEVTEVQTQPTPVETTTAQDAEANSELRRERLKERLRAVRENPRPEPLPPTVAEAGVLAVERIATLQSEVHKLRAVNLALTQDLEGARRQAEKATEEARLRMEESRRLSEEMEGRLRLLAELERELSALEGERDDALLSLQEARQAMEGSAKEKLELQEEIARRDQSLAESLAEEERLCSELEDAREDSTALRRSVDALKTERDTLARQVSELTRERAELLEARKALEAVHRALSQAASR